MSEEITTAKQREGLKALRKPFPPNQIGKLPKPTKKQTEEAKGPKWDRIHCQACNQKHHKDVIHLDYVGHAAITDRLLDVDPGWDWRPLCFDKETGLPLFDKNGGLWIELEVLGLKRLGYGNAASVSFKDVGSREKEVIGDALRNAGMRFGMALDLWHKGELHVDEEPEKTTEKKKETTKNVVKPVRATLNASLAKIKDPKIFGQMVERFAKKYGPGIWAEKTAHKNETWKHLFDTHGGKFDKKEPNPQTVFDSLLKDRTVDGLSAVCDHYDNHKELKNEKNKKEISILSTEVN